MVWTKALQRIFLAFTKFTELSMNLRQDLRRLTSTHIGYATCEGGVLHRLVGVVVRGYNKIIINNIERLGGSRNNLLLYIHNVPLIEWYFEMLSVLASYHQWCFQVKDCKPEFLCFIPAQCLKFALRIIDDSYQ